MSPESTTGEAGQSKPPGLAPCHKRRRHGAGCSMVVRLEGAGLLPSGSVRRTMPMDAAVRPRRRRERRRPKCGLPALGALPPVGCHHRTCPPDPGHCREVTHAAPACLDAWTCRGRPLQAITGHDGRQGPDRHRRCAEKPVQQVRQLGVPGEVGSATDNAIKCIQSRPTEACCAAKQARWARGAWSKSISSSQASAKSLITNRINSLSSRSASPVAPATTRSCVPTFLKRPCCKPCGETDGKPGALDWEALPFGGAS